MDSESEERTGVTTEGKDNFNMSGKPCEIHGNINCTSFGCNAAGEGKIIGPNVIESCGQLYR